MGPAVLQKALLRMLGSYLSWAQLLCTSPSSSALDAVQEALQLLESVRPEPQAKDQLLDDKAQALLWLYICTLEAKMQEVSVAAVYAELGPGRMCPRLTLSGRLPCSLSSSPHPGYRAGSESPGP